MSRNVGHPRKTPCARRRRRAARRSGQSLIEFAIVSFVVYLLLAAILTFGHALYVAQTLQQAIDSAARELSLMPFPADSTWDNPADDDRPGAMHDDRTRRLVYDDAYLVIDLEQLHQERPGANIFQDVAPQLPLLNRQLLTLMVVDRPDFDRDGIADAWLLRYPGEIVERDSSPVPPTVEGYPAWVATRYSVLIPWTGASGGGGGDPNVQWLPVVEEIDTESIPEDNSGADPDPFRMDTDDPTGTRYRGVVALLLRYPFQSAAMRTDSPLNGNPVTPFRRIITAQAIYRREVFE